MKNSGNVKKIVFVTRRMIMGGIEKALISMLESISQDKYDVTVLVMGNGGELIDEIPNHIKVKCLYGNEKSITEKMWNYTKKGKFINAFRTGWYTILAKKAKTVYEQEMYHSKMLPVVETEYDLAVAYHTPASFPVVYVMNNIKAKAKVAWIHSDISQYERELQPYKDFYQKYDRIFCVSKFALNKFVEVYPNLKEKTSIFYNILDQKRLNLMSVKDEGFNDKFDGIRILTVGRITSQKGQDIIPNILMKLKSKSYNIRWYCIGDGESRSKLESMIKKYGLEEYLVLLGTKKNPYPYIKHCDIYVQPSRHEGYCITLAEARAFNKPIVTTDFVGAREQIENGQDGLITKFGENEIYSAMENLISNKALCDKFRSNLNRKSVNTTAEINKIYDCLS
ncbi:glycosyltransferase [Bacillus pseudomycoides]|nr:glycosyltransferase [Bacillus pseudomycoides]